MGCGHSKFNGYFRKSKSQTNNDYTPVSIEKFENEEKLINPLTESSEDSENSEFKKSQKIKPYGGVLLAQAEVSTSQQDFFKLLDEKIESGPDYDSESETEKADRETRIMTLLQNWQSTSIRSLNTTPTRNPKNLNHPYRDGATFPEVTLKSSHNRYPNVYMNSLTNKPYIPPPPAAYISDYNQNSNLPPYQTVSSYSSSAVQYRTVNYPQDVHHASFTTYRHEVLPPETNFKPTNYQPQYLTRSNRFCNQNSERTVKFNNYYNLPNDSSSSNNTGIHEARIEMNPLHRKQYELT